MPKQQLTVDEDRITQIIDQKLEEKLAFLPTKDEFYTKMDEVVGELKAIREETQIQAYRLSDHEDRLETIETKLAITP